MSRKARVILFSLLAILSILASSCQAQPTPIVERVVETVVETVVVEREGTPVVVTQIVERTVEVAAPTPLPEDAGKKILRLHGGTSEFPSIDPSHSTQSIEVEIIGTTSVGLVRQNEETAEIELGVAESYDVSEDGLVYTFNLRDDIPWVKFDPIQNEVVKVQDCEGSDRLVTADDFKYGVLRTLDPRTASEYAYVLTPYLSGADEFNSAPITDTAQLDELAAAVGIEVVDPQTIAFTFDAPGVYNLNLLGLWVAHAQPSWLIEGDDCTEARSDRWTEQGFFQGYGPFTLKEWVHDYYLTLIKNPFWPGTAEVPVAKIDEIRLTFMDASTAFAEFEAGNLESVGIPAADMDRVLADPAYADMIVQQITPGTEFYAFNTQLAPTDDARVRRALSMAIDRQSIVENVNKSGIPAPFFTNPGVAGAPKPEQYPDLGVTFDPEAAKALLDEYLAETGQTAEELQITLIYNTTEANKRRAEAIQAMWQDNLGLNVELITLEGRVYFPRRTEGLENIYRSSWVQDYPDANNFLYEVFGPGAGYQQVVDWTEGAAFDEFVDLITRAAVETDAEARQELYAQAETILVEEEAIVAPIYWYSGPVLVQSYVDFVPSITGYNHYEKWDIQK